MHSAFVLDPLTLCIPSREFDSSFEEAKLFFVWKDMLVKKFGTGRDRKQHDASFSLLALLNGFLHKFLFLFEGIGRIDK